MNESDPHQERPEGAPDPDAPAVCPGCGGAIPAEAPAGLCPRCLLAEAEADTMRESASGMTSGGTGSAGPGWGAPPLDRIQAAFPGLEILELIGCGGMGAVFKARQPKLDRLVALKILPEKLAHSPAFTERFTREGRALARLSHPNIVGVHDFGEAGGFFFLLMEYVDGVNLRQAMQAGRFTPQQALAVVPEICAALQFAHDQGVLHRDIKPENILLDARGRVKIADFGIAKIVAEPGTPELTLTQGLAAGTPQYMAPEQIERPRDVDHRADIYSLGVVFYELLTGELPLGRFAPPSNKTPIDARVDAIVLRALEKERELRQQSAGEMRTEIETLSGTSAQASVPVARSADRAPSSSRRLSAVPAILVGLALLLPLLIAFPLRRAEVDRARSLAELSRLEDERAVLEHALNTEVALSGEAATPAERAEGATRFDGLSRRRSAIDAEIARLQASSSLAPLSPAAAFWRRASWAIVSGAAILLIALPATVFGWRQLGLARVQGPPRPPGIGWAMAAAWTLPALILFAGGFLLVYLPFEAGQWGGQRRFVLALATIGGLVAGAAAVRWIIVRTLRWLDGAAVAHGMAPAGASGASGAPASNPGNQPAPATAASPGANPWPRRIFWLIAIVLVGPPILIALGLLVPWFAYRAASSDHTARQGESSRAVEFPSARHFFADGWSIYRVGHGDRTHWLLLHEGDMNASTSSSHNPATGEWVDDGRLTTPDGIGVDFHRHFQSPDLLRVLGVTYNLRDGRVFVLNRDGRIAQHDVSVPPLTDDVATFLAQVRAALGSASTPGVER